MPHFYDRAYIHYRITGKYDPDSEKGLKEWMNCFQSKGYDEAMWLPYEYDLENKVLTVTGTNHEAEKLGWHPAVNADGIPF